MKLPQLILIVLYALSLGVAISQHGTPKKGTNSFWTSLTGVSINIVLLWWGGFFN